MSAGAALPLRHVKLEIAGPDYRPYCASCDYDGRHYHVWLTPKLEPDTHVYKSPSSPGRQILRLNLEHSRPMRELVAALVDVVRRDGLEAKAIAECEAQLAAKRAEEARIKRLANAQEKLEAAAPELLKALETLVHRLEHPLEFGQAEDMAHRLARARAAIAAAKVQP